MGAHPDDGEPIEAGVGRYGPYVRHGKVFASLEKGDDVLTIGMNRAMELIAQKAAAGPGRRGAQKPLRTLGEHPEGGEIHVMDGRYGPYVKWEKINATLPEGEDPQEINIDQALELIAAKAAAKGKKKPATKKSGAKKPAKRAKSKAS
ncbi:MAG: topoisomerase C-terminal repeat-containing protein [Pseudomonadota bacterium]